MNIWEEPADNRRYIVVDAETGVRAANLNKLVERLTYKNVSLSPDRPEGLA